MGPDQAKLRVPVDALDIAREDLSELLHARVEAARAATASDGNGPSPAPLAAVQSEGTSG